MVEEVTAIHSYDGDLYFIAERMISGVAILSFKEINNSGYKMTRFNKLLLF